MGNREFSIEVITPRLTQQPSTYESPVPGVTPLTPATFDMLQPTEETDRIDAARNASQASKQIEELNHLFNQSSEGEI